MRNVRDQADVVLYLVNASEAPGDAGYLAPELAVLEWIGKPVIVLLNQAGPPRPPAEERADETRWRDALASRGRVRDVLTLDAFARCWVQEFTLFAADRRRAAGGEAPRLRSPDRCVDGAPDGAIRRGDGRAGATRLRAPPATPCTLPADRLMARLGKSLGLARPEAETAEARAAAEMAARLDADLRAGMDRLIEIHALEGRAAGELLARLATDVRTEAPMDEGKAAALGGVVTGALTGLGADLATGGLTFGAGMLAGALLGALGGAGVARGVNVARGRTEAIVRWDERFLDGLVAAALLRYLAVAHYGRGRGEWRESEYPPFWREHVAGAVASREQALAAIWALRTTGGAAALIESRLRETLREIATAVLEQLYPGAFHIRRAREPGASDAR